MCCSGDTDTSDYRDVAAAGGYDYDDSKDYEPGAKYSPHYSAGGKGSSSDVFV